tara:strand:+ start:648 stop:1019 length:372 start_codon:yes stop_codon:yes gene_type:complete
MLYDYDTLENKLKRFHKAFGHPIGKEFSKEDSNLPLKLIKEEFKELIEASEEKDIPEIKKELVDLVYVCVSMCVRYGWDLSLMFTLVHNSNMTKLDDNGKPIYREDGKILKSNKYIPVDLTKL